PRARRPPEGVRHQSPAKVFKLGSDRNTTESYKQPVDENDVLVTEINGLVIEGNPFTQDARNCTTCHSTDVAKESDA
ncbi:cytochrome C, partial [Vibrio parahaemolyticus]|nr:cytochrome C [Vibrio parahaemolyticus]